MEGSYGYRMPVLGKNFYTLTQFFKDHNLATRETINGSMFYVATMKCLRAKPENLYKEV
jgi:hypothetical protein